MSSAEPSGWHGEALQTVSKHCGCLCDCCGLCSSNVESYYTKRQNSQDPASARLWVRGRGRDEDVPPAGLSGSKSQFYGQTGTQRQSTFERRKTMVSDGESDIQEAGTLTGICEGEDASELKTSHTQQSV